MICPLCSSRHLQPIDLVYARCTNCRGIAMKPELYPTEESEKSRYLEHNNNNEDEGYIQFTSPIWKHILENYSPNHAGLDFGSGTTSILAVVLGRSNFMVEKYDPFFAPNPEVLANKYDYIMACEVIEHFFYPANEFKKLRAMLRPGGKLLCMTHLYEPGIDFSRWYYRRDRTHTFIYTPETIYWIQQNLGFSKVDIEGRLIVFAVESKRQQSKSGQVLLLGFEG